MEKHLIKMPSIGQYNVVVKDIQHQARYAGQDENDEAIFNRSAKLPTLTFKGTVKLHGTNASICMNKDGDLWAQSKGNVITPEKDNAGFAMFLEKHKEYFKLYLGDMFKVNPEMLEVCVYGEWAGKGIQKGVGISELPKTFYMFGIKFLVDEADGDEDKYKWAKDAELTLGVISKNGPDTIKSIFDFETYEIEIDFENPKDKQNEMIALVDEIDKVCPVAKAQGVTGHGEGLVFVGYFEDTRHVFKIKGESHSQSRVKTLKPVDEVFENRKREFANYATPAWRLSQMYQETFDTLNGGKGDVKGTGAFLKAVTSDVMKEELMVMADRDLTPKDVNGMISKIARTWFLEQLDKEIMG